MRGLFPVQVKLVSQFAKIVYKNHIKIDQIFPIKKLLSKLKT